jgi:hypothetical protein
MNLQILAQESYSRVEYLRSLHNRFSESEPDVGWKIVALVVIFLAAVFCFAMLNRLQKRQVDPNVEKPGRLFRRAMKHLKLRRRDRWRLWRVAGALRLEHPAALLLSPNYYDGAIRDYCAGSSLLGNRHAARRALTELRQRIFTEDVGEKIVEKGTVAAHHTGP